MEEMGLVPRGALTRLGPHGNMNNSSGNSVNSKSSSFDQRGNIPSHCGTAYTNVPNAHRRAGVPPPLSPAVSRPFVANITTDQLEGPMLHNRTADGKIIGKTKPQYVDAIHVPHKEAEKPLGPDNPVKDLNHIWSACWDDEAGAVYYYNHDTGEATWVQPEI